MQNHFKHAGVTEIASEPLLVIQFEYTYSMQQKGEFLLEELYHSLNRAYGVLKPASQVGVNVGLQRFLL